MFVTPPIELIELDSINLLHLSISPFLLRALGIIIRLASALIFAFLISKIFKKESKISYVSFLLFLISPWTNIISTFFLIQNLLLLLFISIAGTKKILFLLLSIIPTLFFLNKLYGQNYSFLNSISPKNLGAEINELQKINFLSVEKKFIIPYPIRKFTYNKPGIAIEKVITQFISYFDFEQFTAPNKTYEIIKLSGISPKGNLQLLYIWEVPLIIYGVYLLGKDQNGKKFIFRLFLISIIPFLFFEKKLVSQTAFLTILPILIVESLAIYHLIKNFDKKLLAIAMLCIIVSVESFYNTLFFKPLSYQTPEPYLFREISRWVKQNYDSTKNYIITTKFGSSNIVIPYYLGRSYPNIKYQNFDIRNGTPNSNTYYIGLAGEFVGHGKDFNENKLPSGFNLITEISGEDEPVFDYGKSIWIGYYK